MNEYTVSPEGLRSLKAGLPPAAVPPSRRPAVPKIKPWEERPPRAREKLTSSVRSFQAWRRAQGEFLPSRTRGARRRLPCICPSAGLGRSSSVAPWPGCEPFHSPPDGARPPLTQCPRKLNVPANSRQSGPRAPLAVSYPAISLTTATVSRHRRPQSACRPPPTSHPARIRAQTIASLTSSPPFQCPHAVHPCPSVDSGLETF